MLNIKKELTKKQKIIICIIAAVASIAVAVGATIILVLLLRNPPEFILKNDAPALTSNQNYLSNFDSTTSQQTSNVSSNQGVISNNSSIESTTSDVTSSESQPEDPSKVVVKNYTVDTSKLVKRKYQIQIKHLSQNPELPSGSEVTSLTTVLNFYGYNVSKVDIANKHLVKTTNKNGDFYTAYLGDPATEDGLGCYAKPIVNAANNYISSNNNMYIAVDYSGAKFEKLLQLIESDIPVIIWSTTYNEETSTLNEPRYSDTWKVDGQKLTWIEPEHCMVLIGYNLDNHTAIVSDPLRGIVEYDLDTVKARYLALNSQCIVFKQSEYAPITGITNGATYYTTQCVNVTQNKDIDSITLNNKKVGNAFLINGDQNQTYDIVITYKNGATLKYTVYTKPIYAMLDPMKHANEYNANEDDIKTINEIKKLAETAEKKYSPYSETEAIESVISACDLMLKNINTAKEKFNAIKDKVAKFENQQLDRSDIEAVTSLRAELDALTTIQNLSPSQKRELSNLNEKCSKWLASLQIIE